ncbi:hypothetical protein QBC36DRAFT_22083 [Triangularia setosa]|uniref:RRM domain-containing protein n=1 Tax=Triangularia setosa TaxID=2587417 RepID=A0AAN7A7T5_9PEZI|nr:hypothetical protein QBC36DRAFT_22083 [Podospora setosa]
MTEVSATRLYLGNLPRTATKADIEAHFSTHGTGDIAEIKLMNGFGFIEYKDPMDARDVVPAFHGSTFLGERLTVQFARGTRHRENNGGGGGGGFNNERSSAPRPRRTPHRLQISGLPPDTSWQDLKDFARAPGLDVVYSETGRNGSSEGFVEFETAADLRTAVEKLDGREFKGNRVTCVANTQPDIPRGDRGRSMSPRRGPGRINDYDRRGPPRAYSPHRNGGDYRGDYRDRSPVPRRDYYDDRARPYRSPPRRGPPMDDYPPARRYDDPYRGPPRDYPPPDPYMNGHAGGRPYDRPPPRDFPPRDPYVREPYARDYERRY